MRNKLILILLSLVVTSCANQKSAPIESNDRYYYGPDGVTKFVVVQDGDSLESISKKTKFKKAEIQKENHLESNKLTSGQMLKIPTTHHIVQEDETLADIASLYNTSEDALIDLNHLQEPVHLKIGQKILIPQHVEKTLSQEQQVVEEEGLTPLTAAEPVDNLDNINVDEINKEFNSIQEPSKIQKSAFKIPTPLGKPGYVWPVEGEVVSKYGQASGKFKEGMSISAQSGSKVKAMTKGSVVYVGEDKDFGKMIILKHNESIMSAYAHLSSTPLQKGASVQAGQIIGSVGSSGTVDSPQLYLSIRRGAATIDPEKILN